MTTGAEAPGRKSSLAVLGICVALLIGLLCAASSIAAARSQSVESAYWPDQPTLKFSIFMPASSSVALTAFASELNQCVTADAAATGSDAFGVLPTPGWKASIERWEGSTWDATLGFGALGRGPSNDLVTEIGDIATESPDCIAREGGSVTPLVLADPLEYQVVGPISRTSADASREVCANWTTVDGSEGKSFAQFEPNWLGEGTGKLICSVDERRPIKAISLRVGFHWNGVNADYNVAGLSSLLVLNDGDSAEIFRVQGRPGEKQHTIRVAPSEYQVAVHATSGEEITSVAPGEMSFSVRQYATADLQPGDGTVVRSANTVLRGWAGAAEQLIWMLTGVLVGGVIYAIRRVDLAFGGR